MPGPMRRVAPVASAALAVLLLQPLVATPSYAGYNCGDPLLETGDCNPPVTDIVASPTLDDQGETTSEDADFRFESQDESASDPSTFRCRLEGPAQAHTWSGCTDDPPTRQGWSTGSRSYAGLTPGSYTFSVRATDSSDLVGGPSNEGPTETFTWTVVEPDGPPPPDDDAPQTTITNGATRWYPFSYLGITYVSDEAGAHFRCTLDGQGRSCDDEQANFLGMKAGDYVFTVAAVDSAGNADPTPARERWTVPMNNTLFKTYSKGWDQRSGRGYFQDTYAITDRRGAYIEQAKRGFRSLVLVATRCPGCGTVDVLLKGERLRTVDLSSPTTEKRQIIPVASWRKPHAGRVRIVVRSEADDVIIEGLGFSARR